VPIDEAIAKGQNAPMSRPVIGVSANIFPAEDRRFYKNKELLVCERALVGMVLRAGGTPIILPVIGDDAAVYQLGQMIDGLLLSGGADVDPTSWGEQSEHWPGQPERDRFEIALLHAMRTRRRPVLGVCRGLQVLNVGLGGTLILDIQTHDAGYHAHRSQDLYCSLRHPMTVTARTWAADLFGGKTEVEVNSVHHQAIDRLADSLTAVAWSDDGLIEAVHADSDTWTRGVQWHPEWDDCEPTRRLFQGFVDACNT
jgi:putative glutamine amidotransferase